MGLLKQSKKKVSIDFSTRAYQLLSEYTREFGVSNSALINFLLENILSMDEEERNKLAEFYFEVLKNANKTRLSVSSDFEIQVQNQKIERYSNLIDFFATRDKIKALNNMQKLDMKSGYIIYPDDWIVVDYCEPAKCKYAGVVSMRNAKTYNIPTFLFFCNMEINELPDMERQRILKKCEEKYPDFEKIQAMQVVPAYNSERKMLNAELWMKAPTIGFFQISEYGKDDVYPDGAMVVLEE